jgi:hypothetical protein
MIQSPAIQAGEWAVLVSHIPGQTPEPIGLLLREAAGDRLHVKLRPNWWSVLPEDEGAELWSSWAEDMQQQAEEMGAGQYLDYLETTGSHLLQLSARQHTLFQNAVTTLDSLYQQEVERVLLRPEPGQLPCVTPAERRLEKQAAKPRSNGKFWSLSGLLGAMAAGLLVGLYLRFPQQQPTPQTTTSAQATATAVSFPPLPRSAPPLGLDLDADQGFVQLATWHPQRRKTTSPPHKAFQPGPLIKPHPHPVAKLEIPAPKIAVEVKPTHPALLAQALPEPPKYRSRNKLLHILSTLASPFKDAPKPQTALLLE